MVKEYSKYQDGEKNLSEHFKVKEFACHDGTDKILIENDMIYALERFREYVENPVEINSAYRTASYNKQIGGATNSYHIYGRAMDIQFSYYWKYLDSIEKMACFFNTIGMRGIIKYSWGCHVDNRDTSYHANSNGKYCTFGKVNIPLYENLKFGDSNNNVGLLQFMLKYKFGYELSVDSKWGNETDWIVRDFQRIKGLKVDGIVGQDTWSKLID